MLAGCKTNCFRPFPLFHFPTTIQISTHRPIPFLLLITFIVIMNIAKHATHLKLHNNQPNKHKNTQYFNHMIFSMDVYCSITCIRENLNLLVNHGKQYWYFYFDDRSYGHQQSPHFLLYLKSNRLQFQPIVPSIWLAKCRKSTNMITQPSKFLLPWYIDTSKLIPQILIG